VRISEVRELKGRELRRELSQHERALMNLRFRKATLQLSDVNEIRKTRRTVARIRTVLQERGIRAGLIAAGLIEAGPEDLALAEAERRDEPEQVAATESDGEAAAEQPDSRSDPKLDDEARAEDATRDEVSDHGEESEDNQDGQSKRGDDAEG